MGYIMQFKSVINMKRPTVGIDLCDFDFGSPQRCVRFIDGGWFLPSAKLQQERRAALLPVRKVLIVGYLVLQAGVPGLVISITARYYSRLSWTSGCSSDTATDGTVPVEIRSSQFHEPQIPPALLLLLAN